MIEERKCFICRGFGYITYHCKNEEEERLVLMPSNRFEVLENRVIQREKESKNKTGKDRRMILRKERAKKKVVV